MNFILKIETKSIHQVQYYFHVGELWKKREKQKIHLKLQINLRTWKRLQHETGEKSQFFVINIRTNPVNTKV